MVEKYLIQTISMVQKEIGKDIPLTMSRVDRKGNSHRIVYEGGKTKRRRSIYKRTRHHA